MKNKVLAVAAGHEITDGDLDNIINKYPEERRMYLKSEQGKKQLLEQTIAFELFNKLGLELGLEKTDEYKETVAALAKEVLTQMTITKLLSEVTITDEEAKKYYDENKDSFAEAPTVSAKHILVDSEEEAKKIAKDIEDGVHSFEEAAMKYSSCPSKEQGGSLGVFGRGMMVPEFEEAAFKAEIGKVTEPVKTQFGYHLILVDAKNEGKSKEFDEVKDAVIGQLMSEAQQRKYLDAVKELENKYGVTRN